MEPTAAPNVAHCQGSAGPNLLPFILKLNTWVLFILATGIAFAQFMPRGPFTHGPGIADQLRAIDGISYHLIAIRRYQWNPQLGETFGHGQSIAFFPADPLLEFLLNRISASAWVMVFTGLCFGLWSNFAFAHLANRLLAPDAVRLAATCFALWPANCFLVMDYPIGFSKLCAVSCLLEYVEGRRVRSVVWCGLGTAASPTMVFIATALCMDLPIDGWHGERKMKRAFKTILCGCVSVFGLLAFMTYQAIAFRDPFTFHEAQAAWFPESLPPSSHVMRLLNVTRYILPLQFSAEVIDSLFRSRAWATAMGRESLSIAWDLDLDLAALLASVFLLLRFAARPSWRVLTLSGWLLVVGYLWFLGTTSYNLMNGLGALYPVCILFLGLGTLLAARPRARILLTGGLSLASFIDMVMVESGYGII